MYAAALLTSEVHDLYTKQLLIYTIYLRLKLYKLFYIRNIYRKPSHWRLVQSCGFEESSRGSVLLVRDRAQLLAQNRKYVPIYKGAQEYENRRTQPPNRSPRF